MSDKQINNIIPIAPYQQKRDGPLFGRRVPVGTWIHYCPLARCSVHMSGADNCPCGAKAPQNETP